MKSDQGSKQPPDQCSDQSIESLIRDASKQLTNLSDSPLLDAELLLASCLKKDKSFLLAWPEVILLAEQRACFEALLAERLKGIPIAYILGYKEFWSLTLKVSPAVLIPRPETELLVELALEKLRNIKEPLILDLGTGSGAIALALAKELPNAKIIAADHSKAALDIARYNKEKYRLTHVQFIESDWLESIPKVTFDLIVSNPPYIESDDIHLAGEIKHEPLEALASGEDGLDDIRIIISKAVDYLKPECFLMLEHGYNQAFNVKKLLQNSLYKNIGTTQDYTQLDRVTLGCTSKR